MAKYVDIGGRLVSTDAIEKIYEKDGYTYVKMAGWENPHRVLHGLEKSEDFIALAEREERGNEII